MSELVPSVHLDDLRGIEVAVREDWGGSRPYVTKRGEAHQARLSRRDQAIRDQFGRGEPIPLLARRWGLTEQWIRRIVR
ncbi:Mor transcription activator family protein [Luteimonas sp. JM171]|uniref:Mor transcription activator family protein n=1 Tax=Luteimonas sp. JM171 TaxID=1896164 RepID=UPI0008573EC1|nr:Mor transcription activator family protein [Luteimonas sp. JM171]AOH36871.1 hypothetical protein BGP89_11325 [Luteimonas sp. JM171]